MTSLFEPYRFGRAATVLANRAVMAPMTRVRSTSQVADELQAEYYAQRASVGLIIGEGTYVSPAGRGFAAVPGIWKDAQVDGWRQVTDAVHGAGGRIIAQLWHCGRVSHTALQPSNAAPVSSTSTRAERAKCYIFDSRGEARFTEPGEPVGLDAEGIAETIADFGRAAANAVAAGFDGVEIHGANGYLIEQFINPLVNDRTDEWGAATVADRLKFPLAVTDAVLEAVRAAEPESFAVGMRMSPYGTVNGMPLYDDIETTYVTLGRELGERGLDFVHVADQSSTTTHPTPPVPEVFLRHLREEFVGDVIFTGGQDAESAQALLDTGLVDLVGFGRPFIANPDLVRRMREGLPLAEAREDLIYAQDEAGYLDYPEYRA